MANLSRDQFMAQSLEINKAEIQNKFDELLPQIQTNLQGAANYFIANRGNFYYFTNIFKDNPNLIDYVVEQLKQNGWDATYSMSEDLDQFTSRYETIKINR
jgi:hypothetical protein